MKNIKFLLFCTFLVFSIIINNTACFANDRAGLLSDMNILKLWDTSDFKDNRYVTKDEFAKLLAEALKMGDYNFNLLYPHDYIEAPEALKMVISALDYEPMAEAKGYLAVAADYRLTSNVNLQGYLTRKSVVSLIYNILSSELMVRDSYQASGISYKKADKNLFERIWDVKRVRGIITEVSDTYVKIDGASYISGYSDAHNYLFMQVDCYYTIDEKRVVYINPSEYTELLIKSYDVLDSGTNFIEYEKNDKVQRISYKEIVKNNLKTAYTPGIFSTPSTHIMAISSQGNSVYDLVFIYEYETYVVDYTENGIIYPLFKDGANSFFGTASIDTENVRLYDKNNEPLEADDLLLYDVIEVSGDTIRVVSETDMGIISEMTDEGIYINEKLYEYADDRSFFGLFNIGDELTVYIDIDGRIAAYKKSAEILYGYLADFTYEKDINNRLLLKIYTENGELNLHHAADNIRINDQRLSGSLNIAKNQMIAYRENKSREITALYTATDNKNDYLTRNDTGPNGGYMRFQFIGENSTLVSDKKRFSLGSDTKVIFVSSRNKGEYNQDLRYPDVFEMHNWWDLTDWGYYNAKIYEATDMQRAKIVLISSPVFNESGIYTLMVVDKVSVSDNKDKPAKNRVYGYVNGKYGFKDIKTGISFNLKSGDVIEAKLNGSNEIIEKPNVLYSVDDVLSEKQCMALNGYAVGVVTECDRSGVVISDVYYPFTDNVAFYGYSQKVPKILSQIRRNQRVILYVIESKVNAVVVLE